MTKIITRLIIMKIRALELIKNKAFIRPNVEFARISNARNLKYFIKLLIIVLFK